jgi:uncharacterized protein HemX
VGLRCETKLSQVPGRQDEATQDSTSSSAGTLAGLLIGGLVLLALILGAVLFFVHKRRLGGAKPFAHVRMQDNVEITNPMYLREDDADDALEHSFTLDSDKVSKNNISCALFKPLNNNKNVQIKIHFTN